jgi:hypothetical protein
MVIHFFSLTSPADSRRYKMSTTFHCKKCDCIVWNETGAFLSMNDKISRSAVLVIVPPSDSGIDPMPYPLPPASLETPLYLGGFSYPLSAAAMKTLTLTQETPQCQTNSTVSSHLWC